MSEDSKPPLFADLTPVVFSRRPTVSGTEPLAEGETEAAMQVAMRDLHARLKSYALRLFPGLEEDCEMAVSGMLLAWSFALSACAAARDDNSLRAEDLDEAMLPIGTSDDQISSDSGGVADGPHTRAVLKAYKADLPPGAFLPEAMIALLGEDGDIKVV